MKKKLLAAILFFIPTMFAFAQTGNTVLVETFTETGCGACAEYDSAFNALMNANAEKVAVLNYHCFYSADAFKNYTRAGDQRYAFYPVKGGFPSGVVNGKKPLPDSFHILYVNAPLIDKEYNKPAQFKVDITSKSTGKGNVHSADIVVKATALKDYPDKDVRVFVVVTENNINYKDRYHVLATNGVKNFTHIVRAMLPDSSGTVIGAQSNGKTKKVKVSYTNDDNEINYKEVRVVAFVQDVETKEVLGTALMNESPFK